jgi:hypothetical protein
MSALIAICVCCAAVVLLAAVYIWRRRRRGGSRASESARRRAVLEDCGDDVVWEAGRARAIAEARGLEPRLGRRMFLKRAALSVTAFAVAWLASRGRGAAATSLKPPSAQGARKAGPMDIPHSDQATHNDLSSPHSDYADHTDNHSDGGGDSHVDVHSDDSGSHNDATPHSDDNGHFDLG